MIYCICNHLDANGTRFSSFGVECGKHDHKTTLYLRILMDYGVVTSVQPRKLGDNKVLAVTLAQPMTLCDFITTISSELCSECRVFTLNE